MFYLFKDIKSEMSAPKLKKRGDYSVSELDSI